MSCQYLVHIGFSELFKAGFFLLITNPGNLDVDFTIRVIGGYGKHHSRSGLVLQIKYLTLKGFLKGVTIIIFFGVEVTGYRNKVVRDAVGDETIIIIFSEIFIR